MRAKIRSFFNNVGKWWRTPFTYGDYKGVPFPSDLSGKFAFHASYCVPIVGCFGKLFLSLGNNVKVFNREIFTKVAYERSPTTPLITICNHTSMIDDPFLLSYLCGRKLLFSANLMRWSLGAKEIMCTNRLTSFITAHGKVIPTVRGEGIYHPAITYAIKQLNRGQWIHIFPEGKITLEPIRLKWGIGRMIMECVDPPIILPYWHCGMEDVFPTVLPYYPRLGKNVTVVYGEPIRYHDVLKQCLADKLPEDMTRKAVTDCIQDGLYKLKPEAERLHLQRFNS